MNTVPVIRVKHAKLTLIGGSHLTCYRDKTCYFSMPSCHVTSHSLIQTLYGLYFLWLSKTIVYLAYLLIYIAQVGPCHFCSLMLLPPSLLLPGNQIQSIPCCCCFLLSFFLHNVSFGLVALIRVHFLCLRF